MKAIYWLPAILIAILSCDEPEFDDAETGGPHKKRIKSIKYSSTSESYSLNEFQYTGETLTGVRLVGYQKPDSNANFEIISDVLYNYIHSDGVITRIENTQSMEVKDFVYAGGRLTDYGTWSGGSQYAYDSLGKLWSERSYYRGGAGSFATTTKVVWDGDNIIKGHMTQSASLWFGPDQNDQPYDTVSFEYGDMMNIFADTTYLGYTLTNVGSLRPFSQNNVVRAVRRHESITYDYTFSSDNFPIKIVTTWVIDESVFVNTMEIEYEE